jgi:hypothetical protein
LGKGGWGSDFIRLVLIKQIFFFVKKLLLKFKWNNNKCKVVLSYNKHYNKRILMSLESSIEFRDHNMQNPHKKNTVGARNYGSNIVITQEPLVGNMILKKLEFL